VLFPGNSDELLTRRAIRRTSFDDRDLVRAIRKIPNKYFITHLSIGSIHHRESLDLLEINNFRNLKHFGTLGLLVNYTDTEETIVGKGDPF